LRDVEVALLSKSWLRLALMASSTIYLAYSAVALYNWLMDLAGLEKLTSILNAVTLSGDPGSFIALLTVGLLFTGSVYYVDDYKSTSCLLVGSAIAVALSAINLLVGVALTCDEAILATLGEATSISLASELTKLEVLLGVIGIPLLLYAIRRARFLTRLEV